MRLIEYHIDASNNHSRIALGYARQLLNRENFSYQKKLDKETWEKIKDASNS